MNKHVKALEEALDCYFKKDETPHLDKWGLLGEICGNHYFGLREALRLALKAQEKETSREDAQMDDENLLPRLVDDIHERKGVYLYLHNNIEGLVSVKITIEQALDDIMENIGGKGNPRTIIERLEREIIDFRINN